ncbi:MAG: hypothetical protein ACRDM7_01240 [Thermoleophilaceae bacterium]
MPSEGDARDFPRFLVQVAITFVFLAAGLWIVFGGYDENATKAAYGWLGFLLGYWLS